MTGTYWRKMRASPRTNYCKKKIWILRSLFRLSTCSSSNTEASQGLLWYHYQGGLTQWCCVKFSITCVIELEIKEEKEEEGKVHVAMQEGIIVGEEEEIFSSRAEALRGG